MQKVKTSPCLQKVKPLLKELLARALQEYSYVSILATDSQAWKYQVKTDVTTIAEDELLSGCGFVIRAYDGISYGEYSFNEISEDQLEDILVHLRSVMALKNNDGVETFNQYQMIKDEPCVFSESTEYETDPADLGDEEILHRLTELKDQCMACDPRVISSTAALNYQKYTRIFLSRNRDLEQNVMWTNGKIQIMVQKDSQVKYCFEGFSQLGGVELLDTMGTAIDRVSKNALDLLDAKPVIPGEYDCICAPDVTGMIAHEAFGHGVEMDMFVKDRALAQSYMGEYVASPIVTMHDGASLESRPETASYFFDDEGTLASDTVIIQDGVLKKGISDAQSAMFLGTVPTGNGRRESFMRKAYTRMTNTWFEPGTDKVEDMIASIDYGFLLENACSGMEDPKNWGIQMMVNIAREIKDGKLTGKVCSPVVVSGYVPDLLKSISMMSDTVKLSGTGFCGKGYKELVKVSTGGPCIRAKIRLG